MGKTYAYIRVSTDKQETENQRFEILKYANGKRLGNVEFIEETVSGRKSWKDRKIGTLIPELQKGDILIVTEFSRLGRSMLDNGAPFNSSAGRSRASRPKKEGDVEC